MTSLFKKLGVIFGAFILTTSVLYSQGPNSPEASGFEPVDATDMVNLTNGNFSYVIPLLDVEGYPVSLSYHAGITSDMDASWVGLGWYLNPGAINRSVNGTPDDWNRGIGINFNSYEETHTRFGVTVDLSFPAVSVGVGLNWGGGQGMSGSVRAGVGFGEMLGDMAGAGASISANTSGDVSTSIGYGASIGNLGGGASLSYSLTEQKFSLGVGAGVVVGENGKTGFENTVIGVGGSLDQGGNFSIGGGVTSAGSGKGNKGSANGGVGMSSSSFSQGDASIDVQTTAVALPLHFTGIPLTIGFSKTKIKINIQKGFLNEEWGTLHSNHFYNTLSSNSPLIEDVNGYNYTYVDHVERTKSMDVYSTRLPQSEKKFIGDYSKQIENVNFTFMSYDTYNVAAQGLIGNLSPRVFQNTTIFGKGQKTNNEQDDPIHVFWHHGGNFNGKKINRKFGRIEGDNHDYSYNDFYFYFDGQFSSIELTDPADFKPTSIINSSYSINDMLNLGNHNGSAISSNTRGRAKSPNYVEVFTNRQIKNGHAQSRGLITPFNISDDLRNNPDDFDPDGIGAYKVTTPDGKTYHFALPVYHFEKVIRSQINQQEGDDFDIKNVNEQRQYNKFATHWLLTAITGSDYIDRPDSENGNEMGTFNKHDYGYWVEFEYGKWSDGYVWRTPYKDHTYSYNTNIKGIIGDEDKGYYSFGRKQLYYLDKINTKNKTALFLKDIRYDAIGKNLNFKYLNKNNGQHDYLKTTVLTNNTLNKTSEDVYVRVPDVKYEREYTLRLDKIILVDSDIGKSLPKHISYGGDIGGHYSNYSPNKLSYNGWNTNRSGRIDNNIYPEIEGEYIIHNENNILTVKNIPSNFVQNNALKVIEFEHDYELAKLSDSSSDAPLNSENGLDEYGNLINGKLTLRSIITKGRKGIDFMPPTKFSYYMENENNIPTPKPVRIHYNIPWSDRDFYVVDKGAIQNYIIDRKDLIDSWGYLQGETTTGENKIKAWSLKDIQTPTGATIEVDYEEDDYWTEAFSRRYWEEALQFNVYRQNGQIKISIRQNMSVITADDAINFTDYFTNDEKVYLDFLYWRNPSNGDCDHRVMDYSGAFKIESVSSDLITLLLPNPANNQMRFDVNSCGAYPWSYHKSFDVGSNCDNVMEDMTWIDKMGNQSCNPNTTDRKFVYRLLANKVPKDQTGGGLRVSQLRTVSDGRVYKANYDYSHPYKNRSSGITSYAPVDGLKYVPYQTEVPPPGVMYEYVTMHESSSDENDFASKTRYRHHVLKPVLNIFNPNIEMQALDANANGEDRIFWANVQDVAGYDGNNSRNLSAKKIDIHTNNAILGQIKSIENINKQGQVIAKTENKYINGLNLINESNKGYVRESFNSMKSIYTSNEYGSQVHGVKRLISVSSKTEYNNMLKRTITTSGGLSSEVSYDDVDPWLGSFRKSITTTAQGEKIINYRVPAYEKYPEMGSKVINPSNKNMLTQQAMAITKFKTHENSYSSNTVSASISTWNKNWTYLNNDGTIDNSHNKPIYRKHQNYVWKDEVKNSPFNAPGTFDTNFYESNPYFDFTDSTGENIINNPTSNKWLLTSEITHYNHWSSPLEVKDVKGNFASSKMVDDNTKVIISGNARFTEMYYSGAEYVKTGNQFEGGVLGADYRTNEIAHTGSYSVKTNQANDPVFKLSGNVGSGHYDLTKNFRPGLYKVSFWATNTKGSENTTLLLNSKEIEPSETVDAGCWRMYNYYVDLKENEDFFLKVTNTLGGGYYFDDFRFHPAYANVTSYVYDLESDDLTYILGSNNMSSAYRYDSLGRLKATYAEVAKTQNFDGGLKISQQFKTHYKNKADIAINYNEDINQCPPQTYYPLTITKPTVSCKEIYNPFEMPFEVKISEGSGNYKVEWSWFNGQQYSPWITGNSNHNLPYYPDFCDEDRFTKVWDVKVKVTDLNTGESIIESDTYKDDPECSGLLKRNSIMLGVESSSCKSDCGKGGFVFQLYPLDPLINQFTDVGYINNITGQQVFHGIGRGSFCVDDISYVKSDRCDSGYVKYVSISPTYRGADDYSYDFYFDCATREEVNNNPELIDNNHSSRYAIPGYYLLKIEGRIISVNKL